MKIIQDLEKDLAKEANSEKAEILQKFFKTREGEYGHGDIFLGITVPKSRMMAKKYSDLPFEAIKRLLNSKIHEKRIIALLVLVENFSKGNCAEKRKIFDFYLENKNRVNNWDLVDLSASKIIGEYLVHKPKNVLYHLAKSKGLWDKRIAIIATFQFVKNGKFFDTLKISKILLKDKHDLIQKAVGWMLREVGKRDARVEKYFLKKYYKNISRTTLRYAIEKFPEVERKKFLFGKML